MTENPDHMFDVPEKREARRFEPPPWEREAFERLSRERSASEESSPEPVEENGHDVRGGRESEADHEVVESGATQADPVAHEEVGATSQKVVVEDPAIEAMLLELKFEEPDPTTGAWKVGLVVGALLGTTGLILIVWGGVALARTMEAGPAGWLGSGIMGAVGAGLVALGVWLGHRSLRSQGVL